MRNRRKGRTAAVVIAIAAFSLFGVGASLQAASDILLVKGVGQVEVKTQGVASWTAVSIGTTLEYGDQVRTGPGSEAEILFRTGAVRMYENTILEIPIQTFDRPVSLGQGPLKQIFLEKGQSLFRILKNRISGGFQVVTPSLIAGVKGTTFRVVEEEDMKAVTVLEGVVEVQNLDNLDEVIDVVAGQHTALADGHLTPATDLDDPESGKPEVTPPATPRATSIEDRLDDALAEREDRLSDLLESNQHIPTEAISRGSLMDAPPGQDHRPSLDQVPPLDVPTVGGALNFN